MHHHCFQFEDEKKIKEAEERRKFPLEQRIKEHIIGQEGAITTVASGKSLKMLKTKWEKENYN